MPDTDELTSPPPPAEEEKSKRKRWRRPLDKEHREARSALIMAAKLANKRTEEIMAEFNLSRATVYRALSDARKMGLLTQARDWMTLNVVPLSLAAIEEALLSGELALKVDTAFRVLDGLGVTGKHAILEVREGGETSFEEFRAEVTRRVSVRRPAASGQTAADAQGDSAVVDTLPLAVEAGTADDGARGDEPPVAGPDSGDHHRGAVNDTPTD